LTRGRGAIGGARKVTKSKKGSKFTGLGFPKKRRKKKKRIQRTQKKNEKNDPISQGKWRGRRGSVGDEMK
jgi:hypothetical protein